MLSSQSQTRADRRSGIQLHSWRWYTHALYFSNTFQYFQFELTVFLALCLGGCVMMMIYGARYHARHQVSRWWVWALRVRVRCEGGMRGRHCGWGWYHSRVVQLGLDLLLADLGTVTRLSLVLYRWKHTIKHLHPRWIYRYKSMSRFVLNRRSFCNKSQPMHKIWRVW